MKYKIFPPIGIARLGNNDDFFIGPEIIGKPPVELQDDGSETPLTQLKDRTKRLIKKQGARFHLFQSEDGRNYKPAELPQGATVTWSVTLMNKKSAVVRTFTPPISPQRPQLQSNSEGLVIDGGTKSISGQKAISAEFEHEFQSTGPNGQPYRVNVKLGRLRTDAKGRLIVLGGNGFSSAAPHTPLGPPYYKNPGWHDDVSDGPITAEIKLPGETPQKAEGGAWVIVGPPDYAPNIQGVVTLFDVLFQIGVTAEDLMEPAPVTFDRDIGPMIERTRRLQWVHDNPNWADVRLQSSHLRDPAPAYARLRRDVMTIILNAEGILKGHTSENGPPFKFREWQRNILQYWVDGNFDGSVLPSETAVSAYGLTRAALDGAVGQGFCPGIEAGIIVLDSTLYHRPFEFRIDHASAAAGDLTALMAQPWQADFLKCNTEWWPTQRPDLAPQPDGTSKQWFRGVVGHSGLVASSGGLGFVAQQGATEAFVEVERDPTLPDS